MAKPSTVREESRRYFAALGAHIAQMRKSQGYTQAELARRIGVSQQSLFAYEIGERRISVPVLTALAKAFGVSVKEVLGSDARRVRKSRVSPRAVHHAERLQALTKTQQRFVICIIDTLEARNSLNVQQRP